MKNINNEHVYSQHMLLVKLVCQYWGIFAVLQLPFLAVGYIHRVKDSSCAQAGRYAGRQTGLSKKVFAKLGQLELSQNCHLQASVSYSTLWHSVQFLCFHFFVSFLQSVMLKRKEHISVHLWWKVTIQLLNICVPLVPYLRHFIGLCHKLFGHIKVGIMWQPATQPYLMFFALLLYGLTGQKLSPFLSVLALTLLKIQEKKRRCCHSLPIKNRRHTKQHTVIKIFQKHVIAIMK